MSVALDPGGMLLATEADANSKLAIGKLLGSGAYARVYSAVLCSSTQEEQEQHVAIKVLRLKYCGDAADTATRACFVREAQALHAIKRPTITRCLGLVKLPAGMPGLASDDGTLGMILELAKGGSLYDLLTRAQPEHYSDAQAVRWVLQLAQALKSLHEGSPQIIHRDVKLENLLLFPQPGSPTSSSTPATSTASVKLTDFGLHQRIGDSMPVYLRRRAHADAAGSHHAAREPAAIDDSARHSAGSGSTHSQRHGPGLEIAAGIKGGGSVRGVAPAIGQLGLTSDDIFFTLDEQGVARSTGSFLSPSSLRAQSPALPSPGRRGAVGAAAISPGSPLRAPRHPSSTSFNHSSAASEITPRGSSFSGALSGMARPRSPAAALTPAAGGGAVQRSSFSFSGSNMPGAAVGLPRSRASGSMGAVPLSPLRSPLSIPASTSGSSTSPLRTPRTSPGAPWLTEHNASTPPSPFAAAVVVPTAVHSSSSPLRAPAVRSPSAASTAAASPPRHDHPAFPVSQQDVSVRGSSRLRNSTSAQPPAPGTAAPAPAASCSCLSAADTLSSSFKPGSRSTSPSPEPVQGRETMQGQRHGQGQQQEEGQRQEQQGEQPDVMTSLEEGHKEGAALSLALPTLQLAVPAAPQGTDDCTAVPVNGASSVHRGCEVHAGIEAAMTSMQWEPQAPEGLTTGLTKGLTEGLTNGLTEAPGPSSALQHSDSKEGLEGPGVGLDTDDLEALADACTSGDGVAHDRAPGSGLVRSNSVKAAATGVQLKALAANTAGSGGGSRRSSAHVVATPTAYLSTGPVSTSGRTRVTCGTEDGASGTGVSTPDSSTHNHGLHADRSVGRGVPGGTGHGGKLAHKALLSALALSGGSGRGGSGSGGGGGELCVAERLGSVAVLLRDAAAPTFEQEFEAVFVLTGETGSFLTMSPEVLRAQPYSAAADIFSLGAVAWEILARTPLASLTAPFQRARTAAGEPPLPAAPQRPRGLPAYFGNTRELAAEVASGWRPAFPRCIHPSGAAALQSLLSACWSGDPVVRPTAAQVVAELTRILAVMERAGADLLPPSPAPTLAAGGVAGGRQGPGGQGGGAAARHQADRLQAGGAQPRCCTIS